MDKKVYNRGNLGQCWYNFTELLVYALTARLCSAVLEKLGVNCETYKADGIIGNHAWAVMPIFKKSQICFEDAYEFVMKYL